MAETGREVAFAINAKAEQYRQELAKLPGWTADAAAKSSAAWAKSASTSAAKEAAGIKAAAVDSGKAWGELGKKISTLAGGPFAQLGDAVFELVPKAGQASAALGGVAVAGAGLAGAVVVAGALALGWRAVADAATAAEERARKAGDASRIPPDARRGVEAYRDATEALGRTADVLVATLGGELAGGLADVAAGAKVAADAFLEWRRASEDASTALGKVRDVTDGMGRVVRGILTLGLSEWFRGAAEEADNLADKVGGLTDYELDEIQRLAQAEDDHRRESAKRAAKAIEDAKKARREAYQRRLAEERETAATILEVQSRNAAIAADAVIAEIDRQLEAIEAAATLAQERSQRTLEVQSRNAAIEADAVIAQIDRQLAAYEDAAERRKELDRASRDFAIDSIGALSDVYAAFGELGVENAEKNANASKKSQRDLAVYQKKVAVTSAILSSITAIAQAIASAPPPFNLPAIATATVTSGIQIGKAASAKIPSLFGGGTDRGDGEGLALLHKGEGVLNARAMDQLVRALNSGLSPLRGLATAGAGGGGGDVYLDTRQVGRVMTRAARTGRGVPTGPPPGYVRRRG